MVINDLVQIVYNPQLKYKGYIQGWNKNEIIIKDLYTGKIKSHYLKACNIYPVNTLNTIYIITNKINLKQYIGRTIGSIENRLKEHNRQSKKIYSKTPLHIDIQKYGIENFKIEKLYEFNVDTQKEANKIEQQFINKFNTKQPNGYNVV